MTHTHATALAVLLLFSMTGCAGRQAAASTSGTTAATGDVATTAPAADPAADSSSEDKSGTGHVSLTGQYPLEHDFTVEACSVAPAGDGLLSGYHMSSKDGDASIGMIAVTLKEYAKDGPYEQTLTSREAAVGRAMTTGVMGPLTMMFVHDGTPPVAFVQMPASKLTITVSNDGAKGIAEFTDLESMPTAEDIDPRSSAPPHGKRASGSVTWTCGTVGHINPTMNNAVNGAFNKLIPH